MAYTLRERMQDATQSAIGVSVFIAVVLIGFGLALVGVMLVGWAWRVIGG